MTVASKMRFLRFLKGKQAEHRQRAAVYRKRLPTARDQEWLRLRIKVEEGEVQWFQLLIEMVKNDAVE